MSLILANQVLIECSKNSHVFDKASLDIEFTLKITSQVSELQQKLSIVRHMLFLEFLTSRYQDIYNLIGNQSLFRSRHQSGVHPDVPQFKKQMSQFNFLIPGKNAVIITTGRIDFTVTCILLPVFCEVINFS